MRLRLRLMSFGALCSGMGTRNTRCANATCRRAPDSSVSEPQTLNPKPYIWVGNAPW
jgi:hypothetical protein